MLLFDRSAGRTRGFAAALLAVLLLGSILVAPSAAAKDKRELTVMTQNLYLGAGLGPALAATSLPELLGAAATMFGTVQYTDFSARSEAIADEIAYYEPDLIGLQEVAEWTTAGPTIPGTDFLDVLMQDLEDRDLSYSVAAVSYNSQIGFLPLVSPCELTDFGACLLAYQDRDVILVNDSTANLDVFNPQSALYEAQAVIPTAVGPFSFDRGWASVDGTFEGKRFRLVSTHLETGAFADVQEAQAAELLAGPAKTDGAVIAVGDFNSRADGSSTASYAMLTKSYFDDAWHAVGEGVGFTCCESETLTNPVSEHSSRIDLVLTHAAARAQQAEVAGTTPFQPTPPFWPSDHAGVISIIRIH